MISFFSANTCFNANTTVFNDNVSFFSTGFVFNANFALCNLYRIQFSFRV